MDVIIDDSSDCSESEFYFESDHVALRGNADYSAVLKTLAILESQRIQATKAIDELIAAEKIALENPEEFIRKLTSGENLDLPSSIQIAEIPKIDFEKYNVKFPEYSEVNTFKSEDITTVRGRIFDDTKPETFNQLWTCEEQRRLEQLLIEYPPEPIEMRRFAKIARALGNRTTKQVASRVQKFFKKLHSVGMPVPGRLPKSRCRLNPYKNLFRPSTFFPAHDVPVKMPNEDEAFLSGNNEILYEKHEKIISAPGSVTSFDKGNILNDNTGFIVIDEESDDENIGDDDKAPEITNNNKVLKLLQRIRRDKEKETADRPQSKHINYECNLCKEEPIIGTRWHCSTCIQESIDFCSDCFATQALSDNCHPISHKFIGLRTVNLNAQENETNMFYFGEESENEDDEETSKNGTELNTFHDKDYLPIKFSKDNKYNYLDPNFLP